MADVVVDPSFSTYTGLAPGEDPAAVVDVVLASGGKAVNTDSTR